MSGEVGPDIQQKLDTVKEKLDDHEKHLDELGANLGGDSGRRSVLHVGGLLGLVGLGATTGSADASGQIGTEDRPLDTLYVGTLGDADTPVQTMHAVNVGESGGPVERVYTDQIDGGVVDGSGPLTSFTIDAEGESVAVRDGDGGLTVADASSDSQAVNRGQDVDWSGAHDFDSSPTAGGVPIVESDSNNDGYWTRWADGTQLVGFNEYPDVRGIDGSPDRHTLSYPRAFAEMPVVIPQGVGDGGSFDSSTSEVAAAHIDSSSFDWSQHDDGSGLKGVAYVAYGRW